MAAALEASSHSSVSAISKSRTPSIASRRFFRTLASGRKSQSAEQAKEPREEHAEPTGCSSEELAACRSCGGQCLGGGLCRAVVDLATDWMLDFVFLCLCQQFKQQHMDGFERSRNTMEALLQEVKKLEQQMETVYLCQFLSRIAEGKNLDAQFEKDESITPLEAALLIWESIDREPGKFGTLHEEIQLLVQIQAVAVCMEKGNYNQATEVLERIFGESDSNKSMKMKLDVIISKKDPYNEFLKGFTYKRMLKKINCFIDIVLSERPTEFLFKAATKVVEAERKASTSKSEGNDMEMETAFEIEKRLSATHIPTPSINEARDINEKEETHLNEAEDGRYLKKRCRMPHVHHTKESTSLEKLPTIEDRLREHKQLFTAKRDKALCLDPQSSLKTLRAHRRKDQSSLPVIRKPTSTPPKKSSLHTGDSVSPKKKMRQPWLPEEDDQLRKGVKEYGVGNWKEILKHYQFTNRTGVMIKDRWRTMQKQQLVGNGNEMF